MMTILFTYLVGQIYLVPHLLAQASVMSEEVIDLLNQGQESAQNFVDAWDITFGQLMNGGVFLQMVRVGQILAALAAAIFILKFFQQLQDGQTSVAFERLILVSLCLLLLANNGALLETYVGNMRDATSAIAIKVEQQLFSDIDGLNAVRAIAMDARASQVEKEQIRLCLQEDNVALQQQCLNEAIVVAEQTAAAIESSTGFRAFGLESLLEALDDMLQYGQEALIYAESAVVGFAVETVLMWILGTIQEAFTWFMETGILLSAVAAPVAVGLSVFNVQALYSWMAGFLSFATAKIAFSLVIAIVSTLLLNAEETLMLVYALFLGLVAPILSMMAAGLVGFGVFRLFGAYGPIVATAGTYTGFRMVINSIRLLSRRVVHRGR